MRINVNNIISSKCPICGTVFKKPIGITIRKCDKCIEEYDKFVIEEKKRKKELEESFKERLLSQQKI